MARPDKVSDVAELKHLFESSSATVLTEYRGLSVSALRTLRRTLGENAEYAVVKNTLAKIAAKDAGIESLDSYFNGPTAIAFVNGEVVDAAKILRDFAKTHPELKLKAGYLDGAALDASEVVKLADLDSREVLLGKTAGVLKASLSKAVRLFAEPLARTARVSEALREKQAAQGPPEA